MLTQRHCMHTPCEKSAGNTNQIPGWNQCVLLWVWTEVRLQSSPEVFASSLACQPATAKAKHSLGEAQRQTGPRP